MSAEARRDISNAVWLCANCSILVDKDPSAYSPEVLRTWRDAAERAARLRIGRPVAIPVPEASVGYILVSGWEGMRELCSGTNGLLARKLGYRIMDSPGLSSIVRATSGVPRSDNPEQKAIDWHRLRELGAPVGDKPWPWRFRDHMRKLAVLDSSYVVKATEWFDITHGTCAGESALDDLIPTSVRASARKQLREWVRSRQPRRSGRWESADPEFEVPILQARYPEALCLIVRHELPSGSRLRVKGRTFSMPEIVLDQRAILLPLGWRFSENAPGCEPGSDADRTSSSEDEHCMSDPTDESVELDDCWVEVRRDDHEGPPLPEVSRRFEGAAFDPTDLEASDPSGDVVPMPDVRRPHAAREFLSVGVFGMSCPEVFVRCGDSPWRYWGPVLVGADSPEKARIERHVLGYAPPDVEMEIAVREVPGERARVRCRLAAPREAHEGCLDDTSEVSIGPRDVLRLSHKSADGGAVELLIAGYFVRTSATSISVASV